jgi:hypothetical protein
MLNIWKTPVSCTAITNIQHHAYNPYTPSYNHNDEIRIAIQQQDLYLLPSESYIYIEGSIARINPAANPVPPAPTFSGNYAAFLFDDIRYELNGTLLDRCKNPGITSAIKGYTSLRVDQTRERANSSFTCYEAATDYFSVCIPLQHLFGFAEDYKKIVLNMKHELILVRSRNDVNCFLGANNCLQINVNKIQWHIPHVAVDDSAKLKLLRNIESQQSVEMAFRSWELYEYPSIPQNDKNIWAIKTANNLNKPRYVLFALQTNKNNVISQNANF